MTPTLRRRLFRLHAWIGLHLGGLLFVVCFSGTVAVFGPELNWLADPALRVEPPSGAAPAPLSWQRLRRAVAEAHPHAVVLALAAPAGPRWAALATVSYGPGDIRRVAVDPHTGRVQGQRSGFGAAAFLRIFHKQLYIVPSVMGVHGTLLVGALALPLLVAAAAGWLALARWWRALVTLRTGRSPRLLASDLHRLAGLWAVPVTAVLCVTGLWYMVETALGSAGLLVEEPAARPLAAADLGRRPPVLTPLDLDRAVALAGAALPGLRVERIALPVRHGDPLTLSGQATAWVVRDRANLVRLDPYDGTVLEVRRGEALGLAARWVETADPLHFGTFAGLPGRVLWLGGGLALSAGILAGLYGAWLRLAAAGPGGGGGSRTAGLAAAVPTLAVLALAVAGTWSYGGDVVRGARAPAALVPLGEWTVGPWTVALDRRFAPVAPPGTVDVALRVAGGATANAAAVTLWTGAAGPPAGAERAARRLADRVWARVPACAPPCALNLRIDGWDGVAHRLAVPLYPDRPALHAIPAAGGPTTGEMAVIALFAIGLLGPLVAWLRLMLR